MKINQLVLKVFQPNAKDQSEIFDCITKIRFMAAKWQDTISNEDIKMEKKLFTLMKYFSNEIFIKRTMTLSRAI